MKPTDFVTVSVPAETLHAHPEWSIYDGRFGQIVRMDFNIFDYNYRQRPNFIVPAALIDAKAFIDHRGYPEGHKKRRHYDREAFPLDWLTVVAKAKLDLTCSIEEIEAELERVENAPLPDDEDVFDAHARSLRIENLQKLLADRIALELQPEAEALPFDEPQERPSQFPIDYMPDTDPAFAKELARDLWKGNIAEGAHQPPPLPLYVTPAVSELPPGDSDAAPVASAYPPAPRCEEEQLLDLLKVREAQLAAPVAPVTSFQASDLSNAAVEQAALEAADEKLEAAQDATRGGTKVKEIRQAIKERLDEPIFRAIKGMSGREHFVEQDAIRDYAEKDADLTLKAHAELTEKYPDPKPSIWSRIRTWLGRIFYAFIIVLFIGHLVVLGASAFAAPAGGGVSVIITGGDRQTREAVASVLYRELNQKRVNVTVDGRSYTGFESSEGSLTPGTRVAVELK